MSDAVDNVLRRLDRVRASGARWIARCPAHGDRSPSLSIAEGHDGRVLLQCFAGCSVDAIAAGMCLSVSDLFEPSQRQRRTPTRGRSHVRPSSETVRAALTREIERVSARLEADLGYVPALRAAHLNEARRRVARMLGVDLAPVAAFAWECPPHDSDPAWPTLYERAIEQERFDGWSPEFDSFSKFRAIKRARAWQRALA